MESPHRDIKSNVCVCVRKREESCSAFSSAGELRFLEDTAVWHWTLLHFVSPYPSVWWTWLCVCVCDSWMDNALELRKSLEWNQTHCPAINPPVVFLPSLYSSLLLLFSGFLSI